MPRRRRSGTGARRRFGRDWASAVVALLAFASAGSAQSLRGWAVTSAQLVELRPFGVDTVPRSEVLVDDQGRFLYEGKEVTCVLATICTGYLPLSKTSAVAATQDVSLTFWGLGIQGLSVTTMLRARGRIGDEVIWPRTDDEFDALVAYAQLQRGPLRVRAGRQEVRSGLGLAAFDGVAASFDRRSFNLEAYGGRSLARGLREPANVALRGLDDFYIDDSVLLIGASGTLRLSPTLITGRYERQILGDRSGLVSERAALDVTSTVPRARIAGSLDYDFSTQRVGQAHLTVSSPFAEGRWLLQLTGRRYVPYFDLSTLWGFFEPVAYSEVLGRIAWAPAPELSLRVSGGWRTYGDTETAVVLQPLTDSGWRAEASGGWIPGAQWAITARYQIEWGPGAFLNSADAGMRYEVSERFGVSIDAMMFQQIEEYRIGEGRAIGGGMSADYLFGERFTLAGGASILRHRDGGTVFTSPWNQARAWSSLRIEIGSDPGMDRVGGAR